MTSRSSTFLWICIIFLLTACARQDRPPAMPSQTADITQAIVTVGAPTKTQPVTPFTENTPSLAITKPAMSPQPSQTATIRPPDASAFPDPASFTWTLFADGFTQPVGMAAARDGSKRLFVPEQGGLIHILQAGQRLPGPFLDLRERTSAKGSTVHGLLGMAFHPNYATNGYFFLHYTDADGRSILARYRVSADPNVADPNSEERLLTIEYPIGEHIGGDLAFGPDGALYIPIGDGGGGGNYDQAGNAQNPDALPGSLLRLDVDHDQPVEVWAYGLRNPWRIAFDSLTGDLFIADVGENKWEEIDFLPAGSLSGTNFGWPYFEGAHAFRGQPPAEATFTPPVAEYDHTWGCSVTGGQVYRGNLLSEWFGVYLYGDFCQGHLWGLLRTPDGSWQSQHLFQLSGTMITSFALDESGEMYLVDYTGEIYRLERR